MQTFTVTLIFNKFISKFLSIIQKDEETTPEMKPSHFLFFAANSTFHGMSHIFTPEKFTLRRLLWALAFVLSFALLLNQVKVNEKLLITQLSI